MNAVVRGIFGAHQAGFAHAEDVEHLRAPQAGEFLALGGRKRFRRANELAHRACREIDVFRFGKISKMKRKTAHADEYCRLQCLDQFQLRSRWIGIAGADPNHADAEHLGAARPDLAGRMYAERKRDVAKVARTDADAGERAAP